MNAPAEQKTTSPDFSPADLEGFGVPDEDESAGEAADAIVEAAEAQLDETVVAIEPAPGSDPEQVEGEAKPEDGAPEDEAKPTEEEAEPTTVAGAIRYKRQAQRYQRSAKRQLAEAQEAVAQVAVDRAQLEQAQVKNQRFEGMEAAIHAGDFDKLIQQAAALSGTDYATVQNKWFEQVANGGGTVKQPEAKSSKELDVIRAELAELKNAREEAKTAKTQATEAQQYASEIDRMMAVQSNPELKAQFPHAAGMPPAYLREELAKAHAHYAREANGQPWSLVNAVAAVDKHGKALQNHYQGQSKPVPIAQNSQVQGNQASAEPAQASQSVTNHGTVAANAGAQRRTMTRAERIRAADQRAAEGAAEMVGQNSWTPSDDDQEEMTSSFDGTF